ncbi:aminotransferase class IV [Candidatus Pelagibacter sp.]|nr:aminotransferase class IV [Candidatus Pelagibacter sp.]
MKIIAGVDEVGRGSLIGPVYAAAVILNKSINSKNIKVHERKIKPEELSSFVGCFLTGTAAEVTPVSCIAENQFKVCDTIIDLNKSYQTLVRKKKAA